MFHDIWYISELHKPENAVAPKLLGAYPHELSEYQTEYISEESEMFFIITPLNESQTLPGNS